MKVVATNKKVICYDNRNNVIGKAGVQNAKDFDQETLIKFALHKFGDKIGGTK